MRLEKLPPPPPSTPAVDDAAAPTTPWTPVTPPRAADDFSVPFLSDDLIGRLTGEVLASPPEERRPSGCDTPGSSSGPATPATPATPPAPATPATPPAPATPPTPSSRLVADPRRGRLSLWHSSERHGRLRLQ